MNIEKEVINLLYKIKNTNISQKNYNDSLSEKYNFDSLEFIMIISEIENHFKISLKDDDLQIDKLDSINSIITLINNYIEFE